MMPWVVLAIIVIIGLLISVIFTGVNLLIEGYILGGVLWLVIGIIVSLICIYMWVVVLSYFTEVKNENDRGRYAKQPYRR